ncbi:TetR/AcrR family transcriptional regulator [Nocardioides immobilis]|uniref:TetR/AcrR family transcriptional regulator n=1 Tax=Nocardioides immobilis TaxID=2049295 RepID=A0A417Y773_9ACTN|nr:TetR/AcrR family transcriptional regulator [Nocardioides immobilis]RHW28550.1 TetR/AcrR family transcriptional regulator [Nocardioides immobilis]
MSDNTIMRRSSYGPSSPEVGRRGADTRRKIVDVSLRLFADQGFFNTSVDAIAKGADVSRATLYQYFPGKDEIFVELLNECGAALIRVARRIGQLGPTDVGLDNLHWWLGEWSWVFEKYRTMFVQWAVVASVDTEVRPEVLRFITEYNKRLAARLKEADVEAIDPVTAATVVSALVHRVNLFQHTGRIYDVDPEVLVSNLSLFLQLLVFPQTPDTVLNSLAHPTVGSSPIELPAPPATTGLSVEERGEGLSKRAAATVRNLVDAGAAQFASKGYFRTSVDDIVVDAGFARGTFYKYFSEKQDLLLAVTVEAATKAEDLAARMRELDLAADDDATLRGWLADFMAYMAKYSGSIDVWTEHTTDDELIRAIGAHAQASMDLALEAALTTTRRTYPFDPVSGALILRGLITRLPEALREMAPDASDDQIIDLMATCIRRGFFSHAI